MKNFLTRALKRYRLTFPYAKASHYGCVTVSASASLLKEADGRKREKRLFAFATGSLYTKYSYINSIKRELI
ncbi:MAG: hypothetical protein PHY31_09275 [Smithellaceae bacterium]|nr:hypothetical protein [Smithellaceae bacterium]